MSGIFISYRRDETAASAGRIYDRLSSYFGPRRVFFDRTNVQPGSDFISQIEERVASADAMVAVMGERWLTCMGSDGKRRLDDPQDVVRREVVAALERGMPLFPVLVSGARFPASDDLPEALRRLSRLNALEVAERSFSHDLDNLIEAISAALPAPLQNLSGSSARTATLQKKVCMVGAYGVGKTSLVRRFVESIFDDRYLTTVGTKIDKKIVRVGSRSVTLLLWDLAGDDEVTPLRMGLLGGAAGYVLVADGLRSGTLKKAHELRRRIEETIGVRPFVLAVNKSDRRNEWQITSDIISQWSKSWTVFETSAKTGRGVEEMFRSLAGQLLPDCESR